MADRNEVRVSDQDHEMLAIKAISAALAPLDQVACGRVIQWADHRYGKGKGQLRVDQIDETITKFYEDFAATMKKVALAAQEHGVSAIDLVRAVEVVVGEAERIKAEKEPATSLTSENARS